MRGCGTERANRGTGKGGTYWKGPLVLVSLGEGLGASEGLYMAGFARSSWGFFTGFRGNVEGFGPTNKFLCRLTQMGRVLGPCMGTGGLVSMRTPSVADGFLLRISGAVQGVVFLGSLWWGSGLGFCLRWADGTGGGGPLLTMSFSIRISGFGSLGGGWGGAGFLGTGFGRFLVGAAGGGDALCGKSVCGRHGTGGGG